LCLRKVSRLVVRISGYHSADYEKRGLLACNAAAFAGFLLGLFFDPEGGGDMLIRNFTDISEILHGFPIQIYFSLILNSKGGECSSETSATCLNFMALQFRYTS
jgi:hypothetical protein